MKTLTLLSLVFAAMALGQNPLRAQEKPRAEPGEGAQPDAKALIGNYRIVSGERNGKKIDSQRLKDVNVRIDDKFITTFDKDKREFYAASYELDTASKPWKMKLTATIVPKEGDKPDGKGSKADGLIEISGESVKFIYSLPEGKPPTEFKTSDNQQMFTMKAEKQEAPTKE